MDTISYTLALSLFDSLSTAQQIVIFALLLSTLSPVKNSLAFLGGLIGSYFICGILGFLALDRLMTFLNTYFPNTASMSDTGYHQLELVTGMAMTAIGIWYYRKYRFAPPDQTHNLLVARLKSITAIFAFGLGVFISVSSFPFSIPYLIALGKYSALNLSIPSAAGSILLYNVGYAFPMLVIFAIYLVNRNKAGHSTGNLQEKTRILNIQLTTGTLVGVGLFTMTDAGFYFSFGRMLVNGRFL